MRTNLTRRAAYAAVTVVLPFALGAASCRELKVIHTQADPETNGEEFCKSNRSVAIHPEPGTGLVHFRLYAEDDDGLAGINWDIDSLNYDTKKWQLVASGGQTGAKLVNGQMTYPLVVEAPKADEPPLVLDIRGKGEPNPVRLTVAATDKKGGKDTVVCQYYLLPY